MKLTKTDKVTLSKKLGDEFKAKDVFFASFQGLKFKDINTLKESLRPVRSSFKVMRNTIVSHAITNAALQAGDAKVAKGPTAVITMDSADDITRAAKALMAFAKANPALKIKGGLPPAAGFPGFGLLRSGPRIELLAAGRSALL